MLRGADLTIFTDNKNLTYANLNCQCEVPKFDYIKAKHNTVTDFLSCVPVTEGKIAAGPYGLAHSRAIDGSDSMEDSMLVVIISSLT